MISIIVPIYNTEKYLKRCIESILNQTYKNIELLLIDDGSTDNSLKICEEYALKDDRIRVFHKENGGQGSARNMGIENAKGEYIGFVDSDDYISPQMYEILLNDIETYDADISSCRTGHTEDFDVTGTDEIRIYENDEIIEMHLKFTEEIGQSPADKLYKKKMWDEVRFLQIRAYEDAATIYRVLYKAKKVVYRDISLYHYIRRDNSTMTQPFSKVTFQMIDVYYQMYKDIEEWYPELCKSVKVNLLGAIQYCVGESYGAKNENAEFVYAKELDGAKKIVKQITYEHLPVKQKLILFLIKTNVNIYGVLYKRGKQRK